MKYTEKTGDIENVYEGTPQEIMDLYNKMNSKNQGSCKTYCIGDDSQKHIMPFMHGDEGPELIMPNKTLNPLNNVTSAIKHNLYKPVEVKVNVSSETNIDKVCEEIAKKFIKTASKI